MAYEKPKPVLSPEGKFRFCHLNTPDTKFNADGDYKCQLVIEMEIGDKYKARIDQMMQEALQDAIQKEEEKGPPPVKRDRNGKEIELPPIGLDEPPYEAVLTRKDEQGNQSLTGETALRFKINAKGHDRKTGKTWSNRPPFFDAAGNTLEKAPDFGDSGKVAFIPRPYYNPNTRKAGVSMRLHQILVTGRRSGSFGTSVFGVDPTGYVEGKTNEFADNASSGEVEYDENGQVIGDGAGYAGAPDGADF